MLLQESSKAFAGSGSYRSSGHLFEDLGYPFGSLALPSWQHHQPASYTSTASSVALLLSSVLTSIVSACNLCHLSIYSSSYRAQGPCLLFDYMPLPAYTFMHLVVCSLYQLLLSVIHVVHQNKCTGEAFFAEQVLESMVLDLQQAAGPWQQAQAAPLALGPPQSQGSSALSEIGEGPKPTEEHGFAARVLLFRCKSTSILPTTCAAIVPLQCKCSDGQASPCIGVPYSPTGNHVSGLYQTPYVASVSQVTAPAAFLVLLASAERSAWFCALALPLCCFAVHMPAVMLRVHKRIVPAHHQGLLKSPCRAPPTHAPASAPVQICNWVAHPSCGLPGCRSLCGGCVLQLLAFIG